MLRLLYPARIARSAIVPEESIRPLGAVLCPRALRRFDRHRNVAEQLPLGRPRGVVFG